MLSNRMRNNHSYYLFVFGIFIFYEFGLPGSSNLNVGISLSNILFPLASPWFECMSFPGSCLAYLGSQSCFFMCCWYWYLLSFEQFLFKWPTSPYLQQWTSPVSSFFTCSIALADLHLQCLAKCPSHDRRNIFSEVLCDQSPLVPQFWFLGGHGPMALSEISFPAWNVSGFSFMTVMHRKSWYNWLIKTPLVVILQLLYLLL